MTTKPIGQLIPGLLLATGVATQVLAAKDAAAPESEEAPSALTGTFEYGAGYVSDD